jgi:hypothetical protein
MKYSIIRKHFKGEDKFVKVVDTLEEAQAHCQREDTHGAGWFDAYIEGDFFPRVSKYNGVSVNSIPMKKAPSKGSITQALTTIY